MHIACAAMVADAASSELSGERAASDNSSAEDQDDSSEDDEQEEPEQSGELCRGDPGYCCSIPILAILENLLMGELEGLAHGLTGFPVSWSN